MPPIPFDPQPPGTRMCAACCAVMLLRSYRKLADRGKIWKVLKQPDERGGEFIKTYRLTDYFIKRRLTSLAVRAKDPLALLDACVAAGIHAVLVCRSTAKSSHGHFMLLVSSNGGSVTVHDPESGPNRVIDRKLLRELFEPAGDNPETTPRIVILVANKAHSKAPCASCGTAITSVRCRNSACNFEISLGFLSVLGCNVPSCSLSNLQQVICPKCDNSFEF